MSPLPPDRSAVPASGIDADTVAGADRLGPARRRSPRRLGAVIAVLGLVLAACGSGDDAGSDGEGGDGNAGTSGGDGPAVDLPECPLDALDDADGPVEVVLWHAHVAKTEEALQERAQAYNESQDRVVVRVESQGTAYTELWDKYLQAAAADDLPAIALLEDINMQSVIDSGTVLPAQSCLDAAGADTADFVPSVTAYYSIGDVLWPASANVSSPLLYFNRNHLSRAGLDPDAPPETLDELRSAAEAIQEAGVAETPLVLNLESWYIETWLTGAGVGIVDNDNGRGPDATLASTIDDPAALELYEWIADMHAAGLLLAFPNTPGNIDHFLAMAEQNGSMMVASSAAATAVEAFLSGDTSLGEGVEGIDDAEVDLSGLDIDAAPLPGIDEPGRVQVAGAAWYLTNTNDPEVQAAAWDFVTWWNQPENQVPWHIAGSYLPFSLAAGSDPEVLASWEATDAGRWLATSFAQLESSADIASPGPVMGPYDQFREINEDALAEMILRGAQPADVVAGVAADTTEVLVAYDEENF